MKKIVKNGIKIEFPDNLDLKEVDASYEELKDQIKNKQIQTIVLRVVKKPDGLYVKQTIRTEQDIQRLRRITGYLTNSVERWNDAKQHEEKDRVKHTVND